MFVLRLILAFHIFANYVILLKLNANCEHEEKCDEGIEIRRAILIRQSQRADTFRQIRESYTLDDAANEILRLSPGDLFLKLQSRHLNATQVLRAYMAKAIIAQDKFNSITEFVPFAWETAEKLDTLSKVQGPLHGIPICVKDDHNVIGMDTTLGLGKNLNKPALTNGALVQALADLGATVFCKTNVPQTLFRFSSDNPIYGETLNHRDPILSPGGSSCGSASLVAAGGAVFATGTDIAGSVRIPAHFSGLCTLKPTQNRISDKGILPTLPKLVGLTGIPGVLANDVGTVTHVFKALLSGAIQNAYDPNVVPISWNSELYESSTPLRFGYYTSLSFFPAIGDTILTVLEAKSLLENLGHVVVPFHIENDWELVKIMNDIVAVDFGDESEFKKLFANEPSARGLEMLRNISGRPDWQRVLDASLSNVTKLDSPEYSARGSLLLTSGTLQCRDRDVWELMYQKKQFTSKILTQMQEANLDLILAPVFPFPACRINDTEALFGATEYTMLWNFVDFPAGVIPFGIESGRNIDDYNDEGDAMLRLAKESTKASVGSNIGVQIIGKPFKEELVLRAMTELFNKVTANK